MSLSFDHTHVDTDVFDEQRVKNIIYDLFFICPRCGMVFHKNSKHNCGKCCSFCITDEEKQQIENRKQDMRKQLEELYR